MVARNFSKPILNSRGGCSRGTFLFIQTSRHKNYFRAEDVATPDGHDIYPSNRVVVVSIIMLLMALTGVILLSKKFAVILEIGLNRLGAPQAVAGIVIAMVVLAPESITALRAAHRNMLQKSLNLALGSSLATIGLPYRPWRSPTSFWTGGSRLGSHPAMHCCSR
jgi:Ca2+:H+ antiporter